MPDSANRRRGRSQKLIALAKSPWFWLDLVIIFYELARAVPALFTPALYSGIPSTPFSFFPYVIYPASLIVTGGFMLAVAFKRPSAAIPILLFMIPFGEFSFMAAVVPTLLDPHIHLFGAGGFSLYNATMWGGAMTIGYYWLKTLRVNLRWTRVLGLWFLFDCAAQFFEPYYHTTLASLLFEDVNIALMSVAIWYMFGFSVWSGTRHYEVAPSVSAGTLQSASTRRIYPE